MAKKEQVFVDNPNMDVAYKTNDGKYFFTEGLAKSHASTLKNKEVTKVVNLSSQEEVSKTDDELEVKIKELEALELVSKNYAQMKSLITFFDIKTESQKADDYIKALEVYKKDLE